MFSKRRFSGRVTALAAGVILFLSATAYSQPVDDQGLPGWVLYEKGLFLYEQGKLDQALEYFNLSAKSGSLTPEANYSIGRIYEEEGDYLLAEKQYDKALEDARFLYIPEQKWSIYYSLAGIYLNRDEYDRYEQMLLSVLMKSSPGMKKSSEENMPMFRCSKKREWTNSCFSFVSN